MDVQTVRCRNHSSMKAASGEAKFKTLPMSTDMMSERSRLLGDPIPWARTSKDCMCVVVLLRKGMFIPAFGLRSDNGSPVARFSIDAGGLDLFDVISETLLTTNGEKDKPHHTLRNASQNTIRTPSRLLHLPTVTLSVTQPLRKTERPGYRIPS